MALHSITKCICGNVLVRCRCPGPHRVRLGHPCICESPAKRKTEGIHIDVKQPDPATPNMVTHPPHYNAGEVECIDAIRLVLGEEGFRQFCQGNALKYRWRAGHKGDALEDIAKAEWYEAWLRGDDPRHGRAEASSPTGES